MSINFNKLFIQDILARRDSGSHNVERSDEDEDSEEEAEYASDEDDESGSDELYEPQRSVVEVKERESTPTPEISSAHARRKKLISLLYDLRAAVERQTNLQNQIRQKFVLESPKTGEKTEVEGATIYEELAPQVATLNRNTEDKTENAQTKEADRDERKPKEEEPQKPTIQEKKDVAQTLHVKTSVDNEILSFKQSERLSKRKGRVIVEIRVVFLKIGEIDTLKQTYRADAFIQAKWREPRLDGKTNEDIKRIDLQRCWNPLLLIDNVLSESKDQHWTTTERGENDEVFIVERRRLRGVFLETLELNDFPLDVQDLSITLTSERPDSEVALIPDRKELCGINLQTLVAQQEWKLHEHIEVSRRSATQEYTNSSQSHPSISVTCRAARRPGYFYWNVFLIMFFITGLSFATFAVPPERPENRLQLSFTLFLTSVAFKFVINQSLPKISYLTYMDKYVLMSLAILCVVSVWHAVVTLIPTDLEFEKINEETPFSMHPFSHHVAQLTTVSMTTENVQSNATKVYAASAVFNDHHTGEPYLLDKDESVSAASTDSSFNSLGTSKLWDEQMWKDFASQSAIEEKQRRHLKIRIENDVFVSFCVLYVLAHLTFGFWLYFDASKRRRDMVERDRQYKRCLQASAIV